MRLATVVDSPAQVVDVSPASPRPARLITHARLRKSPVEEDQSQPENLKSQGTRSAHPLDQRIVQVARVVMATKQQVEQLNGAVAQLTSQQQHIDDLATDLKQRLSEFHERLGEAGNGDGQHFAGGAGDGLGAQIQKLDQDLAKALAGIDSTAERVELASSRMDEQVFALKARVTGFAEGVEQWFKPARHEIEANREFVERASEQIREKIEGFEQAAQSLQACFDHGVADLKRRHEACDTNLDALASKLDDCLERLEQNPERMSELALDRLRPLVDALTRHVTETCVGEKQLGDHLQAVQTQIESAVTGSEQRVTPILSDLGARLDASEVTTEEIRETCRALQNQVGGAFGQLDDRIAGMQKSIDTALGAKFDDRLDRLEGQVAQTLSTAGDAIREKLDPIIACLGEQAEGRQAVDERVASQLVGIRDGLETWGRRSEEDAVHRTELSAEQREIGAALGRLEEKIEAALDTYRTQTNGNDEQVAGVARRLDTISEQLDTRLARILSELHAENRQSREAAVAQRDGLAGGQQQLGAVLDRLEEKIEATLDTCRAQTDENGEQAAGLARRLDTISEQLDARVARSLSQIHTENCESRDAAAAQRDELAGGQKELGMAMLRLQGKVTDSLTTLAEQQSKQIEQAGRLAGELVDLRGQLTTLGDQLGGMTAQIDNRVNAAIGNDDQVIRQISERLAELDTRSRDSHEEAAAQRTQVAEAQQQLGVTLDRMQGLLETTLNDPRSEDRAQLARVERYLTALREHVVSLGAQIEGVTGKTQDQEQLTEVKRQLDDLREHMSTLGDQLTALTGDPSETHEQMANVERRMNELGTQMADLKSLLVAVPAKLDQKVAEAISRSSRTPSREQEQLTGVERQLDDLREHIASLTDRVESAGGQTQITELQKNAVTREYLSDVVGQLEQQVTTAISEAAVRESDGDLSRQIEGQLDGLQTQLATLGERLGSMESSLTELDMATHAAGARDHGIRKPIEEHPARFETSVPDTRDQTPDFVVAEPVNTTDFVAMDPVKDAVAEPVDTTDFVAMDPDRDVVAKSVNTTDFVAMDAARDAAEPEKPIVLKEVDRSDDAALREQSPLSDDTVTPDDAADDEDSDTEPVGSDEPDARADSDPDTMPVNTAGTIPRDELVDTLINVINSGNAELIHDFIQEQYAMSALTEGDVETRVEVFMDVHEATGEMRVVNSAEGDEGEIVLVLQTRRSLDRQRFVITLDTDPPHKIVRVNIDRI